MNSSMNARGAGGGQGYAGPFSSNTQPGGPSSSPYGGQPQFQRSGSATDANTSGGGGGGYGYQHQQQQHLQPPPASTSGAGGPAKPSLNSPEEIENSRRIARVHYHEFRAYLEAEGMKDPNARQNAREKLTRLTRQQFQELSTDVYDELVRRQDNRGSSGGPDDFLPVRNDFHPKRNAARQKLATLPKTRFRDLASDVFFELERRYPEFNEAERPYSSMSNPDRPNSLLQKSSGSQGGNGWQSGHQQSHSGPSTSTPSNAANEVIVPNKSTLVEEDLNRRSVDEPRERANTSSSDQHNDGSGLSNGLRSGSRLGRKPSDNYLGSRPAQINNAPYVNGSASGPASPDWIQGQSARASEASSIGTRLVGSYGDNARHDWEENMEKVKSDYEYKIATMQSRIQSLERDLQNAEESSRNGSRDADRARDLENQLDQLQQRHEDASSHVERLKSELEGVQEARERDRQQVPAYDPAAGQEAERLQRELNNVNSKHRKQTEAMDNLQSEFEGLVDTLKAVNMRQDELANQREEGEVRIQQLEEEVRDWKKRYESTKSELRTLKATSQLFVKPNKPDDDYMPTSADGAILDTHVTTFQSSIDDLLIGGRSNAPSSVIIATKQVINAVAKIDDDVQAYEAAGGADHLSEDDKERLIALKSKCNAVLSNLTTAARNHATGHGLSPVSLLDAAASHLSVTIIDLVRLLHLRKGSLQINGQPSSNSGTPRQITKPIGTTPLRLGSLRQNEPSTHTDHRSSPTGPNRSRQNTSDRGVDEVSDRMASLPSQQSQMVASSSSGSIMSHVNVDPRRNGMNRPDMGGLPAFDEAHQSFMETDYSPQDDKAQRQSGYEDGDNTRQDDTTDLKNYLEAQTEAIVHSITALLAAIRGGAQAPKLDEKLTQIITIVSSIIGILHENLPASLRGESESILADLSEHCNKLIELQASGGDTGNFTKPTKQAMATASFGVAKSLKSMNGLLGA